MCGAVSAEHSVLFCSAQFGSVRFGLVRFGFVRFGSAPLSLRLQTEVRVEQRRNRSEQNRMFRRSSPAQHSPAHARGRTELQLGVGYTWCGPSSQAAKQPSSQAAKQRSKSTSHRKSHNKRYRTARGTATTERGTVRQDAPQEATQEASQEATQEAPQEAPRSAANRRAGRRFVSDRATHRLAPSPRTARGWRSTGATPTASR